MNSKGSATRKEFYIYARNQEALAEIAAYAETSGTSVNHLLNEGLSDLAKKLRRRKK
jgi:hypothetical protein